MNQMYSIKLRHYKRGTYGTTIYKSPVKAFAYAFAQGYKAALKDVGISESYVSVHDAQGKKLMEADGKRIW